MTLYCATGNPGKLREFRQAGAEWIVEPLPGLRNLAPPEETGRTFEENAVAKALYYGAHTSDLLFAEDSGLEVEALAGAPGVFSARFAGPESDDGANNRLLLERLRGVENRRARYVCVIALVKGGRLLGTFRGTVEGEILDQPRGTNGFGYDPLFFYPPFGCAFGETSADRKITVSHRGRALAAMFEWLRANGA